MKLRTPSPSMVVAIIAVVLSLTGAADAARNAVVAAIKGHPVSSKPLAGGILLLGKNRKFPRSAIPAGKDCSAASPGFPGSGRTQAPTCCSPPATHS